MDPGRSEARFIMKLKEVGVLVMCRPNYLIILFQATIGIDFLSKTMYLEDRTVSINLLLNFILVEK